MDDRRTAVLALSSEVTTKSRRTRQRFQEALVRNLRDVLASSGVCGRVRSRWSRLLVETRTAELPLLPLSRVSGVCSVAPVEATCDPRLDSIVETGERTFAARVRGRCFAVRGRSLGRRRIPSSAINERLGAALDRHGRVDLDRPEVTVHVEVHDEAAFFFTRKIRAPGGLPLGVEGRAVVLLSGGFDSAVAASMMLKRGLALDYAHCNLAGPPSERAVLRVAKVLADGWSYGSRPRLHMIDFTDLARILVERVTPDLVQVVLKRWMYRAAEAVVREAGAQAIVTGESIGQVSSQTPRNLRAISSCAELPVFRPLVGFNKDEIIERSRALGIYELSAHVREYCALSRGRPRTAVTAKRLDAEEARIGTAALERAIAGRRVVELRCLGLDAVARAGAGVSNLPAGAEILDIRPREQYEAWHHPRARWVDGEELFDGSARLSPERAYVLVCEHGPRSESLAERLRRTGIEAYSLDGGARLLRRRSSSPSDGAGRRRGGAPELAGAFGPSIEGDRDRPTRSGGRKRP